MNSGILQILFLLPLLGAGVMAFLPRGEGNGRAVRLITLGTTLITFAVSLIAIGQFDFDKSGELQFASDLVWVRSFGLSFGFGVDSISMWLIMLTTFLLPLTVLGSFTAVSHRAREFFVWLLVLEAAMIGTFVATDLIFFYICFEFTLVPLYFLIGIWGSSERRRASRIFFLYTFTGSLLTFAGVMYVAVHHVGAMPGNQWTFSITKLVVSATDPVHGLSAVEQGWVLAALLAGFAVKVPLFPFHTWLPLAHTEAPTAGSVVLAGVLLKLGTYGILRLALPMCPSAIVDFAPVVGVLAVIGILYTGLICWVQKDIKKLIAYSSVSHLGFCVLGLFAVGETIVGTSGSVMYMINHGLSTGALFLCVGMIYERFHTRQMRDYSGVARVMPVWSFFMVFFCLASVGLPGLNGFVGEFLTLLGAFRSTYTLGPAYAAFAGVGMIIGAIYILYMVGNVIFGPTKVPVVHDESHSSDDSHTHALPRDLNLREIVTLIPLAIACLVLGLYPNLILKTLDAPVKQLTDAASHVAYLEKLDSQPAPATYVDLDAKRVTDSNEQSSLLIDRRKPPSLLPELSNTTNNLLPGPELIRRPIDQRIENDPDQDNCEPSDASAVQIDVQPLRHSGEGIQ